MNTAAAACMLGVCFLMPQSAAAHDYRHLTLVQAIDKLERQGLSVFYSSDLIKRWMRVRAEPNATAPRAILEEILRPYALRVREGPNGSLLLVRARASALSPSAAMSAPPPAAFASTSNEITVNASRYELLRERPEATYTLASTQLELLPQLGDDPLRTVARLPGTARGDFGAKTHVRGGEADEMLVRFDGLRLYNPFHFKDFQSLFSAIDPAAIEAIDVYTGGFPALYGDRISGVLDIVPAAPRAEAHREVAISFFNTSGLASGNFAGGDWLVSARRGNLDLAFDATDPSLGRPRYRDAYVRIGRQLTDTLAVTANALLFEDALLLFDSDQEEQARADYRDRYAWLRLDHRPNADLSGHLLLARSTLDSLRSGSAALPGVARGSLNDRRELTIDSLQTEWSWQANDYFRLQFGGEWRNSEGRYDYDEQVEFELLFQTPGAASQPQRTRRFGVRPRGRQYGAYTSLRLQTNSPVSAEAGLRWDRETFSAQRGQFSPRLNLMYALGERARLRLGWGRFFQSQAIHELQISDGVTHFFAPQRADHLLAELEYREMRGVNLRVAVYRKRYDSLRPRFENLLNTFVLLPELKPDRVRVAPERALAQGVELTLERAGHGAPGWWLSYSGAEVRDVLNGAEIPRNWNQTHAVSAGLTWRRAHWDFSLAGRFHSGWATTELELTAFDPIPLATTGPRNSRRMGLYASLDARAARTFHFKRAGVLTVFAEITNLFNRRNHCCVEYQIEDETDVQDPLLDVEPLDALPALPSLGLRWRF